MKNWTRLFLLIAVCMLAVMAVGCAMAEEHDNGANSLNLAIECSHDFYGKDNGDGTHTQVCDICGAKGKTEAHYITCIADQLICSGCGAEGAFQTWHSEPVEPVDNGDGTCFFTCRQCGKNCTEKHYFIDGECDYCGAKKDAPVKNKVVFQNGMLGMLNGDTFIPGNGLIEFDGGLFVVNDGYVMTGVNGLAMTNGVWYYFAAGQVQTQYTGMVQYDGAWFYVTAGQMLTSSNGLFNYDGSKFLVSAGKVRYDYSGLFQNTVGGNADNKWYFIANGQVQTQYTGLAQYDGHWFYLVNGVLAEDYTGEVSYDGGVFNVVNGMVQ